MEAITGASRLRILGQSHSGVLADETTTDVVELAKLSTMMPFCDFEFAIHVGNETAINRPDVRFVLRHVRVRPAERSRYVGNRSRGGPVPELLPLCMRHMDEEQSNPARVFALGAV